MNVDMPRNQDVRVAYIYADDLRMVTDFINANGFVFHACFAGADFYTVYYEVDGP